MTMKMKGLLKGLRYISQIFENNSYEEKEMQIGHPTDVKHVAHIGWDGPQVNSPSWMNEFRSTPEYSSAPLDMIRTRARDSPEAPKSSRRQQAVDSPGSMASPTGENSKSERPKQSRRHQSAGVSMDSPTRDLSEGIKPTRRQRNLVIGDDQSPREGQPVVTKQSRRKSKGRPGGGSIRTSRTKGQSPLAYTSPYSDPGSGSGSTLQNKGLYPTSPLRALVEKGM